MLNKRIVLSSIFILTALTIVVGATFALFSDTETSIGNVLAAGEVDLGIDNHSYYNGVLNPETTWRVDYDLSDEPPRQFFNFTDVKPGDWGEDTISLHVRNNDAWVCADVTLTSSNDNGLNEPESLDGDTSGGDGEGELAGLVNFFWWADDGDNVFEEDETLLPAGPMGNLNVGETATVALADALTNIWGESGPFPGDEVRFLAKAWCFGNTSMTPYAQDDGNQGAGPDIRPITCDGSQLNNTAQTDGFTADIAFRAVQARHNPGFTCTGPGLTPTTAITPTIAISPTPPKVACETADNQFANASSNNNQGLRKNGTAILADRTNPSSMFGAPQTAGLPSDVGIPTGSFFSLGFTGGNIVIGFPAPFAKNPSGADIQVYEVTGGVYPDEMVQIETAPTSGGPWTVAAPNPGTRDAGFEMGTNTAQFVRLTEASNIALFEPEADGYDVDAVKTLCRETVQ